MFGSVGRLKGGRRVIGSARSASAIISNGGGSADADCHAIPLLSRGIGFAGHAAILISEAAVSAIIIGAWSPARAMSSEVSEVSQMPEG